MKRRFKQRGSALVEMVFFIPVLFYMFFGMLDFALAFNTSIALDNAVFAGAQYASSNAASFTLANAKAAAVADATVIPNNPNFTATTFCTCSPGGATTSCSSTCTSYGTPITYVKVTATVNYQTLVPYLIIPSTLPLGATATLRVQ